MDPDNTNKIDLINYNKEQLIEMIFSMQENINQLKHIIYKYETQQQKMIINSNGNKKSKPKKEFNFSQYKKRHILLKFLYLGWNYSGFVIQKDSCINTVEKVIFEALLKTKLIESRETCNYHRCGRTDKGVSAFSQVISLTVRSKLKTKQSDNEEICTNLLDNICDEELDYISILNNVLPRDIRIIAWAPVLGLISARFDCTRRIYRYYFPRIDLNIEQMNEACKFLVGEHDFRNLCKMDVNNGVINYRRHVYHAGISISDDDSICMFHIEASAFLWHQIRYIMAVLFLVGQNLEPPNIVAELLDTEKHPSKPQFSMASDLPLILFDVHYDKDKVPKWIYGKDSNINSTLANLYGEWADKAIQCALIKSMIDSLKTNIDKHIPDDFFHVKKLFGNQSKNYMKLFDRPLCDSFEEQVIKSKKKMKIQ